MSVPDFRTCALRTLDDIYFAADPLNVSTLLNP
jgi:hypothetical protein